MGIPHLITHLQPYGVDTPLLGTRAVLDGPSLAYHIWHLCSKSKEAQPSHKLLAQTAVAWLQDLSDHGVQIEAIYFDGFLPPAKRDVRMDRLLKMSLKLQHLHAAHSASCPERFVSEADSDPGGFRKASDWRQEPVHTAAFLVPAVIDYLRSSPRFGSLVRLVPGEADVYCAQHVLEHGGCVITSDSDLLLHDLDSGSVILFQSIDVLSPAPPTISDRKEMPVLLTPRYSPPDIAQRLGIPPTNGGMMRFGFELFNNPQWSLSQIVDSCQRPAKSPKAFAEFSRPYQPLRKQALPEAIIFSGRDGQILDPRISEVVLQSDGYMKHSFPTAIAKSHPGNSAPHVFLPLIFDCPAKASAWDSSTDVRQLAYSLLQEAYPDPSWTCVREFRRIQSLANKGRKVDLLRGPATKELAVTLLQSLDHVYGEFEDRDRRFFCLALYQDMVASQAEDKYPTSLASVRSFFQGGTDAGRVSWATIHLVAQVHATCYSLRLLSQITRVVLASQATKERPTGILGRLESHLNELPNLTEYPTVASLTSLLDSLKRDKQLDHVASVLGIHVSDLSPAPARRSNDDNQQDSGRKKRRRSGKGGNASQSNRKQSTNPFDILSDD